MVKLLCSQGSEGRQIFSEMRYRRNINAWQYSNLSQAIFNISCLCHMACVCHPFVKKHLHLLRKCLGIYLTRASELTIVRDLVWLCEKEFKILWPTFCPRSWRTWPCPSDTHMSSICRNRLKVLAAACPMYEGSCNKCISHVQRSVSKWVSGFPLSSCLGI